MMKRKRLIRIVIYALIVVMAGLVYGIFVKYTGLAIPCFFRRMTGLKCPGCGITGMCVALMQFDFKEAFRCHPMLFVLLTPLGIVFARSAATYVQEGTWRTKRWQDVILYICIALLVGFGVVRNIIERM